MFENSVCLYSPSEKKRMKEMKEIVGLHGPLAVNVDATMWHDYLGAC